MNKKISSALIVSILVASLGIIGNTTNVYADKKECYDIKYEEDGMKMPGKNHDDNNPSESKAMKMIFKQDATICEVAYCYDNDECEGEITGKDLKKLKDTVMYMGASEDQQDCIDHRAKLPDGGERALQLYEIYDCAVDNYGNT